MKPTGKVLANVAISIVVLIGVYHYFKNQNRDLVSELPKKNHTLVVLSTPSNFRKKYESRDSILTEKIKDVPKNRVLRQSWEKLLIDFGPNLYPQFTLTAQLISVRGSPQNQKTSNGNFDPQNNFQAIKRAKEIISAASQLLGLHPSWPLEYVVSHGSSISAQVFLSESYEGMRVAPSGHIKVDLGPEGQLLALYSDYVSPEHVKKVANLSTSEAGLKALTIVTQMSGKQFQPSIGEKIIWVTGNQGYLAYEYKIRGQVIVIDADTGRVLSSRDKRNF